MLRSSDGALPATRTAALRPHETSRDRRERLARAAAEQAAARAITDETRLTALQADAALALGGHIMDGVTDVDKHRRSLARDDVTLNMLLCEIEAETVQQVKAVQRSLFNRWDF